jgi:hypothetical protein
MLGKDYVAQSQKVNKLKFIKASFVKKKTGKHKLDDLDSFDVSDNDNELNLLSNNSSRHNPRFELDMHNQGLLENIKHIERLNYNLNKKFGVDRAERDSSHGALNKRYAFPFQKRVRSKSPIKVELDSAELNNKKPLIVTKNFLINAAKSELCGLSTEPTDEEKKDIWMYKRISEPKINEQINDAEESLMMDEIFGNKKKDNDLFLDLFCKTQSNL